MMIYQSKCRLKRRLSTFCWGACAALGLMGNVPAMAQAQLGDFKGSPYATWQGLYQQGLQVRTLLQPQKNDASQKVVRRYLQYIPEVIYQRQEQYPLVIVLPGANTSAEQLRFYDMDDRIERLADEEEFMLVYANAYDVNGLPAPNTSQDPFNANQGYWRACGGAPGNYPDFYNIDDTDYLRRVIAQLRNEALPVDLDRIYVWGLSNGGEMALQAARDLGSELAGVAAVMPVVNMPGNVAYGTCEASTQSPVSMMVVYSPDDTVIAPIFKQLGFDYSSLMANSMTAWAAALGLNPEDKATQLMPNIAHEGQGYTGTNVAALATVNSQIERTDFAPKNGVAMAVLKTTPNAGHKWPSYNVTTLEAADNGPFGFNNNDIEAERVIWEFLKGHKRIKQ